MRLWIAQGFGLGRIGVAPGTFGSLLGLGWFILLLATGHLWSMVLAAVLGLAGSVWLCGYGERSLGEKDPSSVVLDEITAMPLCFAVSICLHVSRTGALPAPTYYFSKSTWVLSAGTFVAFRLFDIWKPWPVRQSQRLSGGWGITVDDVLAAAYVNVVVLAVYLWKAHTSSLPW